MKKELRLGIIQNKYLKGKMNQLTDLLESTLQSTSHDSCISDHWT